MINYLVTHVLNVACVPGIVTVLLNHSRNKNFIIHTAVYNYLQTQHKACDDPSLQGTNYSLLPNYMRVGLFLNVSELLSSRWHV